MIVVCKKWRLLESSKGVFKVTDNKKLLRESVKVELDFVKTANANSKTSGIYYEVNEEETTKRNKPEPTEKEILLERAKELGLDVDGRTGVERLKELIAEKEELN